MGDICEMQALEVKFICAMISLKKLGGVKLAKDDYKEKKTRPWACAKNASQSNNQHDHYHLHENRQPKWSIPIIVHNAFSCNKIDYAASICSHNVGLKALKTSCTTWLHQNISGDVKPKKPSSTSWTPTSIPT